MKQLKYLLCISLLLTIFQGFGQEKDYPYAADIAQFRENDKLNPPPANAILFAGSSSFTLWKDVQDYFPGYTIINRGFGGSTLLDQIHYINEIVFPYNPAQIVIYCGENDFAASDTVTAEMVFDRFKKYFYMIREKLPDTRITYVSMKPSPSRCNLAMNFIFANGQIHSFLDAQSNAGFVDIWDAMLDEKGQPDASLFLEDRLHMNAKGYRIWQKKIEPFLVK
jgi:lysophospholipase L1-like esterase